MNNQGPYGNYIQSNSSTTSSVDMTPPGAPFDDDNPLEVPPADNSTGVWRIYEPSNTTTNLTDEFVAADCVFARDHGAGSYSHSCQTYWVRGQSSMLVRVTISGSGYAYQHDVCILRSSLTKKQSAHPWVVQGCD